MALKKLEDIKLKGLTMAAIAEKINSVYGANTMAVASKAKGLTVRSLSTGIYSLDFALCGGFPENRFSELYGDFSTLKSTTLYHVIANFQRRYPDGCAFLEDGEKSFDPYYAEKNGVDLDRLIIINSDCGEQAVDVMSHLIDLDRSVLTIVDSIASLVPMSEMETSAEQQFQGLHPRLVGRLMRTMTRGMKRNMYDSRASTVTLIATNQTREKLGVLYGDPTTTPGGKAKDFYYSVRVKLLGGKGRAIMEKEERNGITRERKIAQTVEYSVNKNKVGSSQFEEGEFTFYIRRHGIHEPFTFNNEDVLFQYGRFYDFIKAQSLVSPKKKKPVIVYKFDGVVYHTEDELKKTLVTKPETAVALYDKILAAVQYESKEGISFKDDEPTPAPKKKLSVVIKKDSDE